MIFITEFLLKLKLANQANMLQRTFLFILLLILTLATTVCREKRSVNPALSNEMPQKILWAWERPEDLRFLDAQKFGAAFLAQTLILERNEIIYKPRRQPLEINEDVYLIAVTRIETSKISGKRPALSPEQQTKLVNLVQQTLNRPNVRGVQIDFDAVASERDFYRRFINELKSSLPENVSLTMTSLASWCVGDAWFNDFPVDEAVPMAFDMGADDEKIRSFLANENDWREPLCRGSYGISLDDPLNVKLQPNRRIYYFKSSTWTKSDVEKLKE
jgi:hypothetical protein